MSVIEGERVDCIVRFHDARRFRELSRCIFSLVGQRYRPLNILLALQRFTASAKAELRTELSPLLRIPGAPTLEILDWDALAPLDGRGAMLNMGLSAAGGRYVGFLDYDDVLYPEAYQVLVRQLREHGGAIAFASVRVMSTAIYPEFIHVLRPADTLFVGETLADLLDHNFCPIHSYLIDREQVAPELLECDATLPMEEDYDLLLRICSRYPSDFSQLGTEIGDYYFKADGSNTVGTERGLSGRSLEAHKRASILIERRRNTTTLSSEVQRALGLAAPRQELTIRDALDLLKQREPS